MKVMVLSVDAKARNQQDLGKGFYCKPHGKEPVV